MVALQGNVTGSPESLASLERLKQVETDGDAQLQMVRGKIDRTLSQLRDESEAKVQAARTEADQEAAAALERARTEADAEAARIIAEAKVALGARAKTSSGDLTQSWDAILDALFDEFR